MAYTKNPTWVDGEGGGTRIDAADLQNIEDGLFAAAAVADGAIPKSLVDAKGDLLTATAADTPARFAVGSDGQILTAYSPNPSGLMWITPTPQYGVYYIGATGSTETLPATYAGHNITMDQNCTFTFDYPGLAGHTFVLLLSGAFTPTWPASVDWADGVAPTYSSPTLYTFTTLDGGTTWLGASAGKAFA